MTILSGSCLYDLHEDLDLFFHLGRGVASRIGMIRLNDQSGLSRSLRYLPLEIVLTERVGFTAPVRVHDEAVSAVVFNQVCHLLALVF